MTIDEQVECEQAVLDSPEFREALKQHTGVDDTSLVMVDIWSAGNYGAEEDRTRRLARPLCFLRTDPTDNGYVRPIEGLRPGRRSQHDEGRSASRSTATGRCRRASATTPPTGCPTSATDIKPLEITQPEGPSFEVEGYQVTLAEVELRHRLQRPRRADAAPPALQRRRPRAVGPLSRLAHRDGRPLRRPGPDPAAARTPSTSASTAWACAPTAWSSAATAWA